MYPNSQGWWHGADVLVVGLTGTIEFTNSAKTIAGTLTDFVNELQDGDIIYDTVDKFAVVVEGTPANATTATAKGNYAGTGGASHACVRIRNAQGNELNISAGMNVILPASADDAEKVLISDHPTDLALIINCEEDALIVWVKASTAAEEVIAANALMRSQYETANLTKIIFLKADQDYILPIKTMLAKGYELYIRRNSGAASAYRWFAYSE
jgi:hypothetical protein